MSRGNVSSFEIEIRSMIVSSRSRIDAAGTVAQQPADLPRQERAQRVVVECGERADCLDAGAREPLRAARPDARQLAHGERPEERRARVRGGRP